MTRPHSVPGDLWESFLSANLTLTPDGKPDCPDLADYAASLRVSTHDLAAWLIRRSCAQGMRDALELPDTPPGSTADPTTRALAAFVLRCEPMIRRAPGAYEALQLAALLADEDPCSS